MKQVKLLRVLQQREFCRLREDLYYRINVIKIDAPPLQERPKDVPLIAMHFLQRYSDMRPTPVEEIEPATMSLLQAYSCDHRRAR